MRFSRCVCCLRSPPHAAYDGHAPLLTQPERGLCRHGGRCPHRPHHCRPAPELRGGWPHLQEVSRRVSCFWPVLHCALKVGGPPGLQEVGRGAGGLTVTTNRCSGLLAVPGHCSAMVGERGRPCPAATTSAWLLPLTVSRNAFRSRPVAARWLAIWTCLPCCPAPSPGARPGASL